MVVVVVVVVYNASYSHLKASVTCQRCHHARKEQVVDHQQNEPEANVVNSTSDGARQQRKCNRYVHQSEDRQAQLNTKMHRRSQSLLRGVNI